MIVKIIRSLIAPLLVLQIGLYGAENTLTISAAHTSSEVAVTLRNAGSATVLLSLVGVADGSATPDFHFFADTRHGLHMPLLLVTNRDQQVKTPRKSWIVAFVPGMECSYIVPLHQLHLKGTSANPLRIQTTPGG